MFDTAIISNSSSTGEAVRDVRPILPCEVTDLCFEVHGRTIIDHIDLQLTEGSLTMIMGPNGAGKSVMVRLLHGMLFPTSGEIRWGGRPIEDSTRKSQAMVFQKPVLLRRSVSANIAFVLALRRKNSPERVEKILDSVGLSGLANTPARRLSGGESQRLVIARALATDPDLLFLDEPTASLDPASVLAIENIVMSARDRGVKIIFITHDIGQARRLADEVIFMHRGKIVEKSEASQFFDKPASKEARDYLAGRIVL